MARHLLPKLTAICLAPALCAVPYVTASGAERVGIAAAVRGIVQVAAIGGVRAVGKKVASGEPIYLGDRVTTGAKGRLQIMLLDETVFTIGPRAVIVIDEFVYDPDTSNGTVAATVLKGTFRFVTGKVSRRDPSKMVVKLPVGSIGVRGTSVAGQTDGVSATVVLLGPGPNTNTGERVGSITVTGLGAAIASPPITIVRPGFATRIAAINQAPTPPVRMDPAQLSAIINQLNGPPPATAPATRPTGVRTARPVPPPPDGSTEPLLDGGGLIEQSGDVLFGGLEGIKTIGELGAIKTDGQNETFKTAQFLPPPGANTTFEQLRSISAGTANFGSQTRPIGGGGTGSYTISYSYDFAARSATGAVSITTISGFSSIGTAGFPLLASPFDIGTGEVNITESSIALGGALTGGTANITYKFRNADNVIFKALDHQLSYTHGVTGAGGGLLPRP